MIRRQRPTGDEEPGQVRVTDRRRINLDPENSEQAKDEVEQPNLKPTYVEELEARTKAAEQQVVEVQARFDQLKQQLQREADETRQRLNRSADERAVAAKAQFISSLLPVMDDLDRAIQATTEKATHETMLQGIRGISTSFQNALNAAGVESISALGEPFNPELHDAVDTGDASADMDGKVIGEYSRGYKLGDRLLRPARVKVGRTTTPSAFNAVE